jgi:hypothetical protein
LYTAVLVVVDDILVAIAERIGLGNAASISNSVSG